MGSFNSLDELPATPVPTTVMPVVFHFAQGLILIDAVCVKQCKITT
jgi:hypothetical protein